MRAFAILLVLALIVAPTFAADVTSSSDQLEVGLTIDEYQFVNFTSPGLNLNVDSNSFDNETHTGSANGTADFDCGANVDFQVHCYMDGDFGGATPTCLFAGNSSDYELFAAGSYSETVNVSVAVGLDQDPGSWSGNLVVETSGQ